MNVKTKIITRKEHRYLHETSKYRKKKKDWDY